MKFKLYYNGSEFRIKEKEGFFSRWKYVMTNHFGGSKSIRNFPTKELALEYIGNKEKELTEEKRWIALK